MTTFSIITDGDKLNKEVDASIKMYATAGARIHVAFVSALWYAAKHGYTVYLDKVYGALRTNDKQAAKLYIRRAHVIIGLEGENPEGLAAEIIAAAADAGKVLDLKKDNFSVVNGHTSKQAQALVTLCEERFINPDGETDKMLLDRNNFAEVKTLGDTQVLANLLSLVKQVQNGSTDSRKVAVSAPILAFLADIQTKAETMSGQLELAANTNTSKPKEKAAKTPKAAAAA